MLAGLTVVPPIPAFGRRSGALICNGSFFLALGLLSRSLQWLEMTSALLARASELREPGTSTILILSSVRLALCIAAEAVALCDPAPLPFDYFGFEPADSTATLAERDPLREKP